MKIYSIINDSKQEGSSEKDVDQNYSNPTSIRHQNRWKRFNGIKKEWNKQKEKFKIKIKQKGNERRIVDRTTNKLTAEGKAVQ